MIKSGFSHETKKLVDKISKKSILWTLSENKMVGPAERLRVIVPDISGQESSEKAVFNDYLEVKRRGLQVFQCSLMLKALEDMPKGALTVVDIGDSAGTHMLYLKELVKGRFSIDSISVNLDQAAIDKIKARGLKGVCCRAENLNLEGRKVDLFTSFQMLEHLHNPAIFLRHLAKKCTGDKLVITVPYMKRSRVGLHNLRRKTDERISAEMEHVFELSPEDWTLLMLHAGWKVVYSKVYYQYPRRWPIISQALALYWSMTDFEGFWGAILEKDTTFSDRYMDWED